MSKKTNLYSTLGTEQVVFPLARVSSFLAGKIALDLIHLSTSSLVIPLPSPQVVIQRPPRAPRLGTQWIPPARMVFAFDRSCTAPFFHHLISYDIFNDRCPILPLSDQIE